MKNQIALLLAGSFFCAVGCFGEQKIPDDVTVNGVFVGGMPLSEAVERVRCHLAENLESLTLYTPDTSVMVAYPELSFRDNVEELLRKARKGDRLNADTVRTWAEEESFLEALASAVAREPVEAQMSFSNEGFTYLEGDVGRACDYFSWVRLVDDALSSGATSVWLPTVDVAPHETVQTLKEKSVLLSSFTTRFDATNLPRTENIRLSVSRISGLTLRPGEEFSFNACVGARTKENGYKEATVIQDGLFTLGVGGGVCQTSTTLFNAVLLAGLTVTESRNHTLSVSYVPPSLDAMVSAYSDFKFKNDYPEDVFVWGRVKGGEVTFSIYGRKGEKTYSTESVLLETVQPPPPEIREGSEDRTIRAEKEGLKSESYLTCREGEKVVWRRLIRRDEYKPVRGILQITAE